MHAPATKTMTLHQPVEQVFAAVVKIVEAGKYVPYEADAGNFRIAFASGKTALSWGNEYIATVSGASGGTLLELECGGIDGAPKALMEKRQAGREGTGGRCVEPVIASSLAR